MSLPPESEESYWTLDPDERAKYVVGDEIEAFIVVHHRANLARIELVFRHVEDEGATITLSENGFAGMNEVFLDSGMGLRTKKSEVKLSAQVTLKHTLGPYELARLVFHTVSGQEIAYEREAALDRFIDAVDEFVVIPEPDWVSDPHIMTPATYEKQRREIEEAPKRDRREPE